jgi:short-subunit dehydrogenase involved in D-alanine esterification of teichoic acids
MAARRWWRSAATASACTSRIRCTARGARSSAPTESLVTGGASEIGLALSGALAARGNTVLVCGRSVDRLERLREELPEIHTFRCDVSDAGDRERLSAWVRGEHAGIDMLVNNAAIATVMSFGGGGVADQAVVREVATNLLAPIHLTSAFLPMLAGTGVRVIEIVPPVVGTPLQRALDVPKMDAAAFAERVLRRFERGDVDIHVGQERAFRIAARLAPATLFEMLNRTVDRARAVANTGPEVHHAGA